MDVPWAWARHSLVSPVVCPGNSRFAWTRTQRITTRWVLSPASSPCTHCRRDAPCIPAGWQWILNPLWWNLSAAKKAMSTLPLPSNTSPPFAQRPALIQPHEQPTRAEQLFGVRFACWTPWTSTTWSQTHNSASAKEAAGASGLALGTGGRGAGPPLLAAASVRSCHITIQQGLSESLIRTAASKSLLQIQLEARLKCLSDCRFVNSHVAVVAVSPKTLSPMPTFSRFTFAFGENSKGFLKETVCHLCYKIW